MTTLSFWPTLFSLELVITLFFNFAWLSVDLVLKPSSHLLLNCLRYRFLSLERSLLKFSDLPQVAHCSLDPLHTTVALLLTSWVPGAPQFCFLVFLMQFPAASWERVHEIKLFRLQSATCWGVTFWIRIHLLSEPKAQLCWVLVVKKSGANMIYDSWSFGQNLSVFCLSGNTQALLCSVSPWSWVSFHSLSGHSMCPFNLNHVLQFGENIVPFLWYLFSCFIFSLF